MVFRALFTKIKQGLAKTRSVFSGVASLFRLKGRVDRDFLLHTFDFSLDHRCLAICGCLNPGFVSKSWICSNVLIHLLS